MLPATQDGTRKRPRSTTSSDSSATFKRGVSEDAILSSVGTPPTMVNGNSEEIDQYMLEQEDTSMQPSQSTPAIPPLSQQLAIVRASKLKPLKAGDTWFVVSRSWYRKWDEACTKGSGSDASLGPIDNDDITNATGELTQHPPAMEGVTVELLPQEAYQLLSAWYGPPKQAFPRKVVGSGHFATHLSIELYPLSIRVFTFENGSSKRPTKFTISRKALVSELLTRLDFHDSSELWRVDLDQDWEDDTELSWSKFKISAPRLLVAISTSQAIPEQTLDDALITNQDTLVVDLTPLTSNTNTTIMQNAEATTSQPPLFVSGNDYFSKLEAGRSKQTTVGFKTASPRSSYTKLPAPTRVKGTIGLVNLGNTCFMNSALQCLAHIPELTEYFLRGVYVPELNPSNPLSTGGVLAKSYGDLLRSLFSPNPSTAITPREFKHRISMHAPAFSGYAQHDSQELLAFLLDGLHEDLNRVLKKPYVEKPDWEGGDLKAVVKLATDTWEGYMRRNDSVIVDLFQGQYKSTLVCPECNKVSITFDPFMYLTLPLPINKTWSHEVEYVPWDVSKPHVKAQVELPQNSSMRVLKQTLAKWFHSEPDNMLAVDFFRHRFYKSYSDHESVNDISDSDITLVYELPVHARQSRTYKPEPTDPFVIPVYHVLPPEAARNPYARTQKQMDARVFGVPLIIVMPNKGGTVPSVEAIYKAVVERYHQWTSRSKDLYVWKHIEVDTLEGGDSIEEISVPNGNAAASSSHIDVDSDSPYPENVAPFDIKANLFTMNLRESPDKGHGLHTGIIENHRGTFIEWSAREQLLDAQTMTDNNYLQPVRLLPSDSIFCEWDPQMLLYFFGEEGNGSEALWTKPTRFVDPETIAANLTAKNERQKRNISLEDCLDEFTKEEKLGEDDLWYCPQCKKHQQATKSFEIWKVPDVLVVHLKRFSNSRHLRDKIDAMIDFPIEGLDLASRVGERQVVNKLRLEGQDLSGSVLEDDAEEPLVYDLFAVDEHLGGLGGGHYRAYAKNDEDEQWYHFDDTHVTKARPEDSVNSNAYLLFYRRRTSRPLGGATHEKIIAARAAPTPIGPPTPPEPDYTTFRPSSTSLAIAPFIGPVLPAPHSTSDLDELPSFDESLQDEIAIPRSDDTIELDDHRGAPSPTSSMDAERDNESDNGYTQLDDYKQSLSPRNVGSSRSLSPVGRGILALHHDDDDDLFGDSNAPVDIDIDVHSSSEDEGRRK